MTIPAKRPLSEVDTCKPPDSEEAVFSTPAAQFNRRVMKKLNRAFEADPRADLAARFPTEYSSRLAKKSKKGASLSYRGHWY